MPKGVWPRKTLKDRFFQFVDKSESCWNWTGALQGRGYGTVSLKHRNLLAHRLSYEIHNKITLRKDQCICHSCDIKKCVNPNHLFIGTHWDNKQDAVRKNMVAFGENHGMAKLTNYDVQLMRQLRKQGYSGIYLEKKFKVNHVTVYRICKRLIWRRVK